MAGAGGDATGNFQAVVIHNAHHIHGEEMAVEAFHTRGKQTSFPLSDSLACSRIHDDATTYVCCVGNPAALSTYSFRSQKRSADFLTRKGSVQDVWLPSIGDDGHAATIHGDFSG